MTTYRQFPFVSAFGRATSPNVASLLGEETVARFSPQEGAQRLTLGGIPAKPGRGAS